MPTSNIDDLLMGGVETPVQDEPSSDKEEFIDSEPDYGEESEIQEDIERPEQDESPEESSHQEDEYGNKTEELSKSMKKRLERQAENMKRKHESEIAELRAQLAEQGASKEVQKAVKDFEYDSNDDENWQKQLADFVKQTMAEAQQEEIRQKHHAEEQRAHHDFRERFEKGMNRFDDFVETVSAQPVDKAMTAALRGMQDPAAFIYAASKRQPKELERISKLRDPYSKIIEMGKLEERMRKNKPSTQAPRTLGRTKEDSGMPSPKGKKEETIEDLIAQSQNKKIAMMQSKRGK